MSEPASARRRWRGAGALAALAVAAAAVVIALTVGGHAVHRPAATPHTVTLPSLPAVVGQAPSRPHPAAFQAPVDVAGLAAARDVARTFLGGYLPYLYGRARASTLTHVTSPLRAQLARQVARVTPAQRTRHPRLLSVAALGRSPNTVLVTATVADGGAPPYPVKLLLQRHDGRWVVAGLPA